jgi:putative ubiquitin-RnfH superfamily antitoxin RatB of RatAB toxin-antitoxin module
MADGSRITVSVVHAGPQRVFGVDLVLPAGATVADAIERSGIRVALPRLEIRGDRLGIFSRKATFETVLRDGDRLEIYRPLKIDPKVARRLRAQRVSGD